MPLVGRGVFEAKDFSIMPAKPIIKLYEDIMKVQKGDLFKSFGRAERLKGEYPTGTLRKRAAARQASMDVRMAKNLRGASSPAAAEARIAQKAALKGIKAPAGKLGLLSLPFQYMEFREAVSPTKVKERRERELKKSALRMAQEA